MILFTREFVIPNSIGQYILTFIKMQEGNWWDIEKVFQKEDDILFKFRALFYKE